MASLMASAEGEFGPSLSTGTTMGLASSVVAAVSIASMSAYEKDVIACALPSSVIDELIRGQALDGLAGFVGHFDVNAHQIRRSSQHGGRSGWRGLLRWSRGAGAGQARAADTTGAGWLPDCAGLTACAA